MIQVSVIIVNYNTAALVQNCLKSLYTHTSGLNYEIILVDNNSPDQGIAAVMDEYKLVKFIGLSENIGFGKACNIAAQQALGSHFFFLNPDAFLCNNAIKMFYDFYISHEQKMNLSCIGTVLKDTNDEDIHSYASFPKMNDYLRNKVRALLGRVYSLKKNDTTTAIQSSAIPVDYVTGANMMISRNNFELANGFDPDYFLYFEETDLQYRLSKMGKQSYLLTEPEIVHFKGASLKDNHVQLRVYFYESMHLYFKKHNSYWSYTIFSILWFFLDLKTFFQKLRISKFTK